MYQAGFRVPFASKKEKREMGREKKEEKEEEEESARKEKYGTKWTRARNTNLSLFLFLSLGGYDPPYYPWRCARFE